MPDYDAFISYSHVGGGELARRLQERIEKFAKPWYRTRSSRVFLDANSLTADPKLWHSIETALGDADWFVLVTSPEAAGSLWVNREIEWWLTNRSAERVILVVASGELRWDEAAGDFDRRSSALPTALRGAFEEEPHWVDATHLSVDADPANHELEGIVADIAAPIRGIPKERLVAAAEREHRRTMRLVRGTIAALLLMLAAAIVAGVVAFHERSSAETEATVAFSKQLALTSESLSESNLDDSILLAVQAFRVDANPETRAALMAADTDSPDLVRFIEAPASVTQIAGSRDGRLVVAGLNDGDVMRWPTTAGRGRKLFHLSRRIICLGVSADGSVVVASDGLQAMLWRSGEPLVELPVPPGDHPRMIGLSPSGRTVVYASSAPHGSWQVPPAEAITVAATADPGSGVVHRGSAASAIDVPNDARALLYSYGSWEWKSFATWTGTRSRIILGAHDLGSTTSADGRFMTTTNGDSLIPVWSTARHYGPSLSPVHGEVEVSLPSQKLLALSPDGSRMAVGGPEEIYDAPLRLGGAAGKAQMEEELASLAGGPAVLSGQTASRVGFANDSLLVSAAGKRVAVWSTTQLDRLEHTRSVPLEAGCEECGQPEISISPDDRRAAVINGDGGSASIVPLEGNRRPDALSLREVDGGDLGLPSWRPDGRVAFPIVQEQGNSNRRALIVDPDGGVHSEDVGPGRPASSIPAEIEAENSSFNHPASVNRAETLLAMAEGKTVKVEELHGHNTVGVIRSGEYATVLYAGAHLLVEPRNGSVEVWDERGSHLERTIPGNGSPSVLAADPDGDLLARSNDEGTITLEDIADGARIATFRTRANSGAFQSGLAFSPNGKVLYSIAQTPGEEDEAELIERNVSDASLVHAACEAAGHGLTAAEWRTLVVGSEPPGDLACG
jgi:WD40 repeat protein